MTNNELDKKLSDFHEKAQELEPNSCTLLSWFWSFFEQTFCNSSEIRNEQILLFDKYCPNFSKSIRCYGITREAHIQNEYAEARKPYYSVIRKFEDGHPDILYGRISPYLDFVPIGKYETPPDDSFFMEALLNPSTFEDVTYERFKAFIFRCFTHIHTAPHEPLYHYIEEDTVIFLEKNYPLMMDRFKQEQKEYLDSIGYTDALQKFKRLQNSEAESLALISTEAASTIIEIRVKDKYIPVVYK